MDILENIFRWVMEKLKIMGAVCLTAMMFLTCADVVGRFFGHPILGSVEIVGFLATLTVALALPYTHQLDGHIGVELFIGMLSEKTQAVVSLFTSILSFGLFALITWKMIEYGFTLQESGEVSMNLQFPEYLIVFLVAYCFLVLTLLLVQDVAKMMKKMRGSS
jgi:TRAP-type C4-dicarboxylate transport system permease small subunit